MVQFPPTVRKVSQTSFGLSIPTAVLEAEDLSPGDTVIVDIVKVKIGESSDKKKA